MGYDTTQTYMKLTDKNMPIIRTRRSIFKECALIPGKHTLTVTINCDLSQLHCNYCN